MPSKEHETVVELFRNRPALAAELLGGTLGVAVSKYHEARISSGEFTDFKPVQYRADAVVILTSAATASRPRRPAGKAAPKAVMAVVVEVQHRHDMDKQWTWPLYLTALRARNKCPAVLMVMCPDGISPQSARRISTWDIPAGFCAPWSWARLRYR